jgi:ABC-type Mn2+/Zn2+ transport system ATPase subunit
VLRWQHNLPLENKPWAVGMIVGPSGCGKSTIARALWGELVDQPVEWKSASCVDDFAASLSMDEIAKVCQAVGFNTIPAWLRPFDVLSNGEKFRANLARRLVSGGDLIVVDEFTSVVDRRVAQIGSHAVQRFIRRSGDRRFVAVTCHYDVEEWLQPDWIFDPSDGKFRWRSVQPRPDIEVEIRRVHHREWARFAPFHYLTSSLNISAACFVLYIDGSPASFAAVLPRPTRGIKGRVVIVGMSRAVTLPDFQGLGLSFVLVDKIASAYKSTGLRFRHYPSHPGFVRGCDRSPRWAMIKRPGKFSAPSSKTAKIGGQSGRPCAVFEWAGPSDAGAAAALGIRYLPGSLR